MRISNQFYDALGELQRTFRDAGLADPPVLLLDGPEEGRALLEMVERQHHVVAGVVSKTFRETSGPDGAMWAEIRLHSFTIKWPLRSKVVAFKR